jgi:riboflavin synthase
VFTGIVDHIGEILAVRKRSDAVSFDIQTRFEDCQLGESICVDGICLTVTASKSDVFSVDLSPETLSCTAASGWKQGQVLHLERALRVGDRLGGHWVTGHVDTTVQVDDVRYEGDCLFLQLRGVKQQHARYLVEKGSVTLDGVSLTVNQVGEEGFSVMLIPQTLQITHFDALTRGQKLHVEYDYLLKWAARDKNLVTTEGV